MSLTCQPIHHFPGQTRVADRSTSRIRPAAMLRAAMLPAVMLPAVMLRAAMLRAVMLRAAMLPAVIVGAALLWTGLFATTSGAAEFFTNAQASRLGLVEVWRRQIEVPLNAQSIVEQQLYVHINNPRQYVEVVRGLKTAEDTGEESADAKASETPADQDSKPQSPLAELDVLLRIPTDRVNSFGQPIGKEEAERLARNEIRRLKRRGIEARIENRTVSRVMLYTLSDDGTVDCRDAETGEPSWMVRVGERRFGYIGMGVGEEYATIVNGGNVIELDVNNGEIVTQTTTTNTPMYGAVQCEGYTIFATIRNGIEAYPLVDPTLIPFRETVAGRALKLPVIAPGSTRLAWATDQGFVYCMEAGGAEPVVLFRLKTDGIVSGRLAAASGRRFFFGSEAGQVYAVKGTRSGKVLWSRPYGEPFFEEPVVEGNQLLIRSAYGNLFSLDTETGLLTWDDVATGVDHLFGVVDGKIYATTTTSSIGVWDLKTGRRIETLTGMRPQKVLRNIATDRLYLVGSSGHVQCLRPDRPSAELPSLGKGFGEDLMELEAELVEAKPEKEVEVQEDFTPDSGADPFGGDADPFGSGADPFGGGSDPFGS
ncbi:outer membrane biogenesis protein BamB [Planctomycetes bacterium CA13]|uniref:Outer membrane biogenesis protein BamB n=1 Tax=Novipirellula herctigrandis TaxID=2527986 RepID=A0A5C5YX80_9BACT|nr:outer membrane biogenesis protein BamB [Planctomycetes bacterium CA13]